MVVRLMMQAREVGVAEEGADEGSSGFRWLTMHREVGASEQGLDQAEMGMMVEIKQIKTTKLDY